MKIAISNIAWDKTEEKDIFPILKIFGINTLEIALSKIWQDPTNVNANEANEYKNYCQKHGLQIVAVQSLLFGHPELTIFENTEKRKETIRYLSSILQIGSLLGITIAVFGSPKNRRVNNLPLRQVQEISLEFFSAVAEIGKKYDIYFCIEPNPVQYGADFIVNSQQAIDLVKIINHPYFRLHLDSGTMYLNNERYKTVIEEGFPYLKHFHISEEDLQDITIGKINHTEIATALKNLGYDRWVSIEMRTNTKASNVTAVKRALQFVKTRYGLY